MTDVIINTTKIVIEAKESEIVVLDSNAPVNSPIVETVVDEPQIALSIGNTLLGDSLGKLSLRLVAGENISALKAIYVALDGLAYIASNTSTFQKALVTGIAVNAAPTGGTINVVTFGIIDDASWSWSVNELLFLSSNGTITQVAPTVGYSVSIGKALTLTNILVTVNNPIQLI